MYSLVPSTPMSSVVISIDNVIVPMITFPRNTTNDEVDVFPRIDAS